MFALSLMDSDIEVDICINNDAPSTATTIKWLKEYPLLKPLFLVLKHGLSSLAVDGHPTFYMMDTKRNGVASFTLICLIVRFLQVFWQFDFRLNQRVFHLIPPPFRWKKLMA